MTDKAAGATVAQRLGAWTAGLRREDVSDVAWRSATRAIVDVVGDAFAGASAPLARTVRQQALADYAAGPASLIGVPGATLAPPAAAHVNAVAAHVLDFDANYNTGMVFAPAAMLPAALAAGEMVGASGDDLLTAFAAGSEIVCVLAAALSDAPYRKDRDSLFYRGWFNTAVLGPIGAAAAAARVLRLDARRTTEAIAIATVQAGGLRIAVGSDMKPYLTGRAAETGLRAALLAQGGAQAPHDAFEGFRGFIQVINGGAWSAEVFDRLGGFTDPGASFKLYPACSSIQAAAEALELLMARDAISVADVATVRCDVTQHIASNLAFPRPETVTQAQFSMPFALGCVLAYGSFTAEHLAPTSLTAPAVQAAMAKIEMHPATLFDDEAAAREGPEATRVTIVLRDGRSVSHLQVASTGKPVNPVTDERLDQKFVANAAPVLGQEGATRLLGLLRTLSDRRDLRGLFAPTSSLESAA
ncbi:MmgE/PrpD family protein [Rhodoplanes roseus]|uniref:2-methylcitrate dehydratase n=1 Tax=Rhodoplanes roseus TaxID=29409 RepID=A0A327L804_9BRAD|nr:MmgE/PrpD family protein [Rhodoplanes roseus]RAI45612.1 hypothetical protein CH341_02915 [Rhodoplanes roseus]